MGETAAGGVGASVGGGAARATPALSSASVAGKPARVTAAQQQQQQQQNQRSAATRGSAGGAPQDSSAGLFQRALLESVVEDSLSEFRAEMQRDVQNLHLDMLRQFEIQQVRLALVCACLFCVFACLARTALLLRPR